MPYTLSYSFLFLKIVKKLKRQKPDLYRELRKQLAKVAGEALLGKPLRNAMSSLRRLHVASSFVVVYEIKDTNEVIIVDFDHHDKIYKKYT